MNKEHKYKDKDEYKDKDGERIADSLREPVKNYLADFFSTP